MNDSQRPPTVSLMETYGSSSLQLYTVSPARLSPKLAVAKMKADEQCTLAYDKVHISEDTANIQLKKK